MASLTTTAKIQKLKAQIKKLEQKENVLVARKQTKALARITALVKSNGLSVAQVTALLGKRTGLQKTKKTSGKATNASKLAGRKIAPKYRNPVFRQPHQRQLMLEALDWLCPRHKIDLFAKEVMDDHVHLFVSCPPRLPIARLIGCIKGGTSYYMRKNHPQLKKYRTFWSKGAMYRSIGSVSAEIVKHYITQTNAEKRGQKRLV